MPACCLTWMRTLPVILDDAKTACAAPSFWSLTFLWPRASDGIGRLRQSLTALRQVRNVSRSALSPTSGVVHLWIGHPEGHNKIVIQSVTPDSDVPPCQGVGNLMPSRTPGAWRQNVSNSPFRQCTVCSDQTAILWPPMVSTLASSTARISSTEVNGLVFSNQAEHRILVHNWVTACIALKAKDILQVV